MASTFKRHPKSWAAAALASIFVVFSMAYPWGQFFQDKLKTALEAQGFQNVELTLSHIGLTRLSLKEISLGNNPPLILKNISLDYSLIELLKGKVSSLSASGIAINVRNEKSFWKISGYETASTSPDKEPFSFPVTDTEIDQIPFDSSRIEESTIHIASDQWQMTVPLQVEWQKQPSPVLTAGSTAPVFKSKALNAHVDKLTTSLSLNTEEKQWTGPWNVGALKITDFGTDIPELMGIGRVSVRADHAQVQGRFENADHAYRLAFNVNYYPNEPLKSETVITDAAMPWMNGTIAAQQVRIPFGDRQDLLINLKLDKVSIQDMLQQLTGKQTTATGSVSGLLPVTIKKDGSLVFHKGALQANEPGVITLPPEAIPGDNPQVTLVRDVLKNLHYTDLSVAVNSEQGKKLSVRMSIAGKNPDLLSGRPVKINVNLTGDMLDFVQQNLLWLSDPQKLLERGENETK